MTDPRRRAILTAGAGAALASGATALATPASAKKGKSDSVLERPFGLVGDGKADDTEALQRVFEAAFSGDDAELVTLPPGNYRLTRPIRIQTKTRPDGNITHPAGIRADGASLLSEIEDGEPMIDIDVRATLRFFRIEGLHLAGRGKEGTGLRISCQRRGTYFYNFCIRDCAIEGCGNNGCELVGNFFEGQIINCYFRDNGRDGARFAHGAEDTVFSAVHTFGSVFGGNHRNGVSIEDGAADVSFHGCYFLLNGMFGLSAETGVTLLSHCGFENNHERAESFDKGDAGLRLMVGGTLVGCTAYSIRKQRYLVRAYVSNNLTMIGCSGSGDQDASSAKLAKLGGEDEAAFTLIGCRGGVEKKDGAAPVEFGNGEGLSFGASWDSANQLTLGDYHFWVDNQGNLRSTRGRPQGDEDGSIVGT